MWQHQQFCTSLIRKRGNRVEKVQYLLALNGRLFLNSIKQNISVPAVSTEKGHKEFADNMATSCTSESCISFLSREKSVQRSGGIDFVVSLLHTALHKAHVRRDGYTIYRGPVSKIQPTFLDRLWVSWEKHHRTRELRAKISCPSNERFLVHRNWISYVLCASGFRTGNINVTNINNNGRVMYRLVLLWKTTRK